MEQLSTSLSDVVRQLSMEFLHPKPPKNAQSILLGTRFWGPWSESGIFFILPYFQSTESLQSFCGSQEIPKLEPKALGEAVYMRVTRQPNSITHSSTRTCVFDDRQLVRTVLPWNIFPTDILLTPN